MLENLPAGHTLHDSALDEVRYDPARHGTHPVLELLEYSPLGHGVQEAWLGFGAMNPGLHGVHEIASV